MLEEIKRSILYVNLKKYPRKIQHPVIHLKIELIVKIINDFKLQIIFGKRSILYMSQVLSLPLPTINQTFLMNNKRAIPRFFGTMALCTQPKFYLFKVNNRNIKKTRTRCEMCLMLTVKTPERRQ